MRVSSCSVSPLPLFLSVCFITLPVLELTGVLCFAIVCLFVFFSIWCLLERSSFDLPAACTLVFGIVETEAIMRLCSCSAIICFSLLLLCHNYDVNGQQVWELNSSYTLTQPNLTQKAWHLEKYPDSLAFLILAGPASDVSTYLCLLSSPTPAPATTSIQEMSFTLSIYMYLDTVVNRGAIVWTANGLHPVSGSSISLCLRSDGNLVLFGDDPRTPFWSSNTAHKGVTTMGVIQYPTVSLVLCNSSGGVVWQSADYPTDTLTSNQYLFPGRNLISWASSSDPSPGGYSLVVEPSGLALYMGLQEPEPEPYWIWSYYGFNDTISVKHTCEPSLLAAFLDPQGALLLQTQFPGAPLDVGSSYWPQFCSTERGYHTSGTLPFKQYATGESVPLRNSTFLRLEHDGNLRAYSLGPVWSPQLDIFESDACRLPNYCGSYGVCTSGSQCACPANGSSFVFVDPSNFSLGCSPKSELHCNASSQKDQTMLQLSGVDHVANNYTPPLNSSTEEACIGQCAQSCSCLIAFWNRGTNACHHADEARSLQGSLDQSIFFTYVKVTSIPQADAKSSTAIIIFASVVSGVFALVVFALLYLCYWYRKGIVEEDDEEDDSLIDATEGLPTRFTYKDLHQITNGFEKQLGRGGFGPVYVGKLFDGTHVAVKKLESFNQGNKEFKAEVATMGRVSHNNLLHLRGFCAQKGHRLLVYEYMENGSLDRWLFSDELRRSQLTWHVRCKIALGIARGLAYLHHENRERIIHLDIKPQNILLDDSFEAKVADFGLSRLVSKCETHVMTTMRGTPGYLAPDWLKDGNIDEKCDVFSFGMLLMEIVSGRKNLDSKVKAMDQVYYPEWAFWQAQKEDITPLTDATLSDGDDVVQLRRMINTAFLCALEDPAMRPSMANVVNMLQGLVPVQEIHLASLHQGLLFVLRNPSSFAKAQMDATLQELMRLILNVDPLHDKGTSSGGYISSFSISAR